MRLVMIDNYDSFTFNLVQLFSEFGIEILVFRNDEIHPDQVANLAPDWICISPGPRDPSHAGISKAVIARFGPEIPLLGVCLGMQAINEVFGGRTVEAPVPVHGKTSLVEHSGESIFRGLPSPFRAARYHSLMVEMGSDELTPLAATSEGVVMAVRHRNFPIYGVQFHPESFLSEHGPKLAENFLNCRTSESRGESARALATGENHQATRVRTERSPECQNNCTQKQTDVHISRVERLLAQSNVKHVMETRNGGCFGPEHGRALAEKYAK